MAIRGTAAAEMIDHLLRGCEDGLVVEPRWFLSSESLSWLEANWPEQGDIRPLMDELPAEITPQHAKLFSKCRAKPNQTRKSSA